MSEIKVNSVKGVGATDAAITINNSDGTCTAKLTNRQTKNLIGNGAMNISQRGTSLTGTGYLIDRFRIATSGYDEFPTQAQVDVAEGTTPFQAGFSKAARITNGNQTGGAGADDILTYMTKIEAQDMRLSGWNYKSSSSDITLSFYVKSSVAQNFYFNLLTRDGTIQNYVMETGVLVADTWTKVTKTISGNSNLTFDNDNDEGFRVEWSLFRGTNLTGPRPLNAWAALDTSTRTPDSTATWYNTNDATFELTGVQLEVGSIATDYRHITPAIELEMCKRYFQKAGARHCGATEGTTQFRILTPLEPPMRASPTVTVRSGGKFNTRYAGDTTITNPTLSSPRAEARGVWTGITTSGRTAGIPIYGRMLQGDLGDFLACDSEI
jgi:hypothetical protein